MTDLWINLAIIVLALAAGLWFAVALPALRERKRRRAAAAASARREAEAKARAVEAKAVCAALCDAVYDAARAAEHAAIEAAAQENSERARAAAEVLRLEAELRAARAEIEALKSRPETPPPAHAAVVACDVCGFEVPKWFAQDCAPPPALRQWLDDDWPPRLASDADPISAHQPRDIRCRVCLGEYDDYPNPGETYAEWTCRVLDADLATAQARWDAMKRTRAGGGA